MKATIQSTDKIVDIDAASAPPLPTAPHVKPLHSSQRVMARVWEGVTESGVKFTAYIPLVQVASKDDNAQFERELKTYKPAGADTQKAIDARFERGIDLRFFVD